MKQLDLRVQKTYKALVEAFERLLLEKEFESISVTEICDAAMIRRPTFYKHFLDKYDFITFFIKHKMNKIFDFAIQKSNDEGVDFFIVVFEQLLDQFDNLLHLIFSIQTNGNSIFELESVREYGKSMLKNNVKKEDTDKELPLQLSYKGQIIMGITIQSVFWYKDKKSQISRKEVIELYTQTLDRLR